ncbi:MAG: MFS transporter [Lapillicoccus sp.]
MNDQGRESTWRVIGRPQRHAIAASLASLALLFFDQTAVVVALPAISDEFGSSANAAQWTVTVYLLALAVVMPLVGRVADRFGRRRVLLVGLLTFGVASALSAFRAVLAGAHRPALCPGSGWCGDAADGALAR